MKRKILIMLTGSLLLSACLPAFIQPVETQAPQETSALDDMYNQTSDSSDTTEPTAKFNSTSTPTVATVMGTQIEITLESVPTSTIDSLTAINQSETFETATGTLISTPLSKTSTPTPGGNPSVTPTDLMVTRQAGSIPAGTKYSQVRLINKSKRQVYISLQWHYDDKTVAYFEYPVGGIVSDKIPVGGYTYVAWVGGKKMTGSFRLDMQKGVTITFYKDRIAIQN